MAKKTHVQASGLRALSRLTIDAIAGLAPGWRHHGGISLADDRHIGAPLEEVYAAIHNSLRWPE